MEEKYAGAEVKKSICFWCNRDVAQAKLVSYCMDVFWGSTLLQCFHECLRGIGDRLGPHMEESPLVYLVVGQFHRTAIQLD